MPTYHMAVDIGASSGRNMLGWCENDTIHLEEVHRFSNEATEKNGRLVWDIDRLFREILFGLKRAGEMGRTPSSIGIDTWGVDFVLLDKDGSRLDDAVAYRDSRTRGMDKKVYEIVGEQALYERTGIQSLIFNSIFQLMAVKLGQPGLLEKIDRCLMLPDYLHYLLTGVKTNEYTISTTGQLIGAESRDWDFELLDALGFPARMFSPPIAPGESVGRLRREVADEVGFDAEVMAPASHDTGSAVMSVPTAGDDAIYLSSGTWSLMGIERRAPDCREACRVAGFTNEGGYDGRYRFLKNIMGLWIVQSLRKEFGGGRDFGELSALAERGLGFESIIDVNHESLLAPRSMVEAIRACCVESGQKAPLTESEVLGCAYNSLARSYAETVAVIEELSGGTFERIHIMGGGCRDTLLNRLTAESTGKNVYAGPVEATALGNILAQMIRAGVFAGLDEARLAVRRSFEIKKIATCA